MLLRRIHIVLAIIELEIDDLINLLPILFPQIIENVEEIRIVEQLHVFVFGNVKNVGKLCVLPMFITLQHNHRITKQKLLKY